MIGWLAYCIWRCQANEHKTAAHSPQAHTSYTDRHKRASMSHHDGQHPPPEPPVFLFLGREARQLQQGHRERVFDVAWLWCGDGSMLASASEANEVRLWAAPPGEGNDGPPSLLCAPLEHEAEVLRVAWRTGDAAAQSSSSSSSSSTLLASATATGRVRLYRVAASKLQDGEEGREVDVQVAATFGHRGEGQVYALHWVGPRQPGGAGSELMTALDDKVRTENPCPSAVLAAPSLYGCVTMM